MSHILFKRKTQIFSSNVGKKSCHMSVCARIEMGKKSKGKRGEGEEERGTVGVNLTELTLTHMYREINFCIRPECLCKN